MASKTETKTPEDEKNLPATTRPAGGDLTNDDFFDGMSSGYEHVDQNDMALPRLGLLQGLSPQVDANAPEYIEGARAGMVANLSTGKIAEQMPVVFAAYERRYVEWSPRQRDKVCPFEGYPKPYGEGLINDYGTDPAIMEKARKSEENGSLWLPSGNELIVTGTWYGVQLDTMSTFFIGMGKTQFTASKKIMSAIRDEKIEMGGTLRMAPIFWRTWNLHGTLKEREGNKWYVWGAKPGEYLRDHKWGKDLLGVIKDLQKSMAENAVRIDLSDTDDAPASGGGGDDAAM